MKFGFLGIGLLVLLWTTALPAQSLTEKLMAEDPARLAEEARERGDIVRGAILYHQANTNCAKCHRASAAQERFGPNLSELSQDSADLSIVESILSPSKVIKEGYETIVASTLDGAVHYGMVVEKNADQIILRDQSNIDQLITIRTEDLDELQTGRKSMMPEGLAYQLANRQQFLDLVRYVIDIKERGESTDEQIVKGARLRRLSDPLEARILMHEHQCQSCHGGTAFTGVISDRQPPNLKWLASRLQPAYLESYIADPHGTQPGTLMPQTLGHLKQEEVATYAEAITHFLLTSSATTAAPMPADATAISPGYELFQSAGCVACHAPRNEDGTEQPLESSLPLGDLNSKYLLSGLVEFLEDPLKSHPSGRMPNMQLTHYEAVELANFLLQNPATPSPLWKLDPVKAAQGKASFLQLGCHRCHDNMVDSPPATLTSATISTLRPGKGCLHASPAKQNSTAQIPDYRFTDQERDLINSYISNHARENLALTTNDRIDVNLRTFNCIACHDRDQLGGVTDTRNPHFQTDDLNLGDQGRIPPTLTGVGAKLEAPWMREVLVNGRSIRPYMKTRMPQYGAENVESLVELFQTTDQLNTAVEFAKFDEQKKMRELGRTLVGNKGLNCVACHTYQYKLSDTMPAVDLTEMAERLKKDWFYEYMLQPQKFSPNTVMPSFWPAGRAIRDDLEGDAAYQIEAMWQYLLDGRQAPMPAGVVRKPMEIVVKDQARMLRRKYPGIGKRGIGVGYPGEVNLAFDAEHLRLATIWRGKFIDPSGVWRGQGSGEARPMGRPIQFTKGPDLDSLDHPWVDDGGRPPKHRFRGYTLDPQQQPTFRYEVDDLAVQETYHPIQDDDSGTTQLQRIIRIAPTNSDTQARFRVAKADNISQISNDTYQLPNGLKIRVMGSLPATVIDTPDGQKQLQVIIEMNTDNPQELVFEYLIP